MNPNSFDILVAKEYEIQQEGRSVKRTAWNRVGRAWRSKSNDSLSFELFLIPNQRYVIQLPERKPEAETVSSGPTFDEAPF